MMPSVPERRVFCFSAAGNGGCVLAALLLLSYFYLMRFEDICGGLLGGGSGVLLSAGLDLPPGRLNGLKKNTAG
jgi:hypothetical protein